MFLDWSLPKLFTWRCYEYHAHNLCAIWQELSPVTPVMGLWCCWITLVIHQSVFSCVCQPFLIEVPTLSIGKRQTGQCHSWTLCEHPWQHSLYIRHCVPKLPYFFPQDKSIGQWTRLPTLFLCLFPLSFHCKSAFAGDSCWSLDKPGGQIAMRQGRWED